MRTFSVGDRGNLSSRSLHRRRSKCLLVTAAASASLALSASLTSAQTNNYFGTGGNIGGATWSQTAGGDPSGTYDQTFLATGGGIANFQNNTTTVTGANLAVAGINVDAGVQVTGWAASLTLSNFNNGVIGISVGSGGLIDFGTQSFTSSTTAGYIKNGSGTVALAGNTYGGGFTLNDGMIVLRGINAMGAGGGLTINGGTIAGSANRSLVGKYNGGGIVVGGNFSLGSTAVVSGTTLSSFTLTFDSNTSLGSTARTITLGGTGTYTWTSTGTVAATQGIISGTGGLVLTTSSGGGTLSFTGASSNTFTGGMTVQGGTLSLGRTAGVDSLATNLAITGGTVTLATSNQINNAFGVEISGGIWGLGVNSETVASVVMTGGNITSTTGVLTSNSSFDLQNGNVTAILGGNVGVVKSGAGSVTLAGANTYTGGTTISAGTLQINAAGALSQTSEFELSGSGRLTINVKDADLSKVAAGGGVAAGTTLRLAQTQTLGSSPGVISGTLEVSLTNINAGYTLQFAEGGRFVNPAGSTGYTSAISLLGNANFEALNTTFTISGAVGTDGGSRTLTLTGANNGLLSGVVNQGAGTLGLVKTGVGQWDVTNITGSGNTFSGPILLNEGTLRFTGNGTTVSSGTGVITIDNTTANDAVLSMTAGTATNAIVVSDAGGGAGRSIITNSVSGGAGFSGSLTLNKTVYLAVTGGNNNLTIGGAISGPAGIIVNTTTGTGAIAFSGSSPGWNGGLTIAAGIVSTSSNQSPDIFGTSDIWIKNGATLSYGVAGQYGFVNHGTIHIDADTSATINWTATSNRNQKINDIEIGSGDTGATLNVGLAVTSGNGMNAQTGEIRLFGDTTFNVNQAANNASGRFNVAGGVAEATSLTTSSLIKTGNGLMVLGGSVGAASTTVVGQINLPSVVGTTSSYKGHTSIWAGTLSLGQDNAMPVTTTVWLAAGGVLDMSQTTDSWRNNSNQSILGLNDLGGGGGQLIGNSVNVANNAGGVTIGNRTLTLSGDGNYSFSGAILARPGANNTANSTLAISKTGSGTQVLNGVATWNGGTNLQGGVLEIGPVGNAVNADLTPLGVTITAAAYAASQSTITVNNAQAQGVVVGMAVAGAGIAAGATVGTVSGSTVVLSGGTTTSTQSASNLTFGSLNRATASTVGGLVIGQTIVAPGQWATGATITSISGNTLSLSTNNTGAANQFNTNFSAWQSLPTTGSVTMSGGTLRWGAGNTADYSTRFATTANQQFNLDTGGNDVTLAGVLASASGSLTKLGAGTLTLGGANTYSGATNLNAGILRLAADERIDDASAINFAGGTLDTGGFEETASEISVSEDSTLDFGAGNSLLAFNTAGTFAGGKTLTIYNYSGQFLTESGLVGLTTDQFIVGDQDNILTPQQLAAFVFVNPEGFVGSYGAAQVDGAVVPTSMVPEPGMVGLLSLGGLGLMRRRRRNKIAAGV